MLFQGLFPMPEDEDKEMLHYCFYATKRFPDGNHNQICNQTLLMKFFWGWGGCSVSFWSLCKTWIFLTSIVNVGLCQFCCCFQLRWTEKSCGKRNYFNHFFSAVSGRFCVRKNWSIYLMLVWEQKMQVWLATSFPRALGEVKYHGKEVGFICARLLKIVRLHSRRCVIKLYFFFGSWCFRWKDLMWRWKVPLPGNSSLCCQLMERFKEIWGTGLQQ